MKSLKALGHPLRQSILQALGEGSSSPSDLAVSLREPLPNVSYHVKILRECDAIELVRTAPVRGALEHFYRAKMQPRLSGEEWATLPRSVRRELLDQTITAIGEHVGESASAGLLTEDQAHLVRTDLDLDAAAYRELAGVLDTLLDRALALQKESLARSATRRTPDPEMHRTELALMHFHRSSVAA